MLEFEVFKKDKYHKQSKAKFELETQSERDVYLYEPYGEVKGTIFYSHGIFMGNNYGPFLRNLAKLGYQTFTIDNGGIGESSHINETQDIAFQFVDTISNQLSLEQIIKIGHSLGGRNTLATHDQFKRNGYDVRSIAIAPKMPCVEYEVLDLLEALGTVKDIFLNDLKHSKLENAFENLQGYSRAVLNYLSKRNKNLGKEYLESIGRGDFDSSVLSEEEVLVIASENDEFGFYDGAHKEKINKLKEEGNIQLTILKDGIHNSPLAYPKAIAKLIDLHLQGEEIDHEIDISTFRKDVNKKHKKHLEVAA